MRMIQRGIVGMLLLGGSVAFAQGPDNKLSLVNATDENVVISVYRPGRVDDLSLDSGKNLLAPLNASKDDRVVVASKAGKDDGVFASPHKVLAAGHFNADQLSGSHLGVGIVKDDEGKVQFVYFVVQGDKVKAASADHPSKGLVEKNAAALNKALSKSRGKPDSAL